jgi:hypothetical protein
MYTYSWTSVPEGFTSAIRNPLVVPAETTRYVAHVNDGTYTITDTVQVTVFPVPMVNAGNDTSYCWWVSHFPANGNALNYSHLNWTTSGDGHFDLNTIPNAVYYPGDSDRILRSVILKLNAYGVDPCFDSVSDELQVNFVCTGIPLTANDKLTVELKPNPSSGVFLVGISGVRDQNVVISILDLQGKIVYHDAAKSQSNEITRMIDLSVFPGGVYVAKIQTEREQTFEKILIQ